MNASIFVALAIIGGLLAVAVWYVNSLRAEEGNKVVRDSESNFVSRFMDPPSDDAPTSSETTPSESRVVDIRDAATPLEAMQRMLSDKSADVQDIFVIGTADQNMREKLVDDMKKHPACAVGTMGYKVKNRTLEHAEKKCDVLDLSHPVAFRRGFFSTDFELPEHDIDLNVWVSSYLRDRFVKRRCFASGEYAGDVGEALDELWQ